jgi:demethylmenaquinone methyltransferase / 2-methoxy-6-polyprenyl-1,4-benzoquinol methylase
MESARKSHALDLFSPLGPTYHRVGAALSFGQDPLWRRYLVGRIPSDGGRVLDVATGTGLVAERLLARGHTVVGLDQSAEMLAIARERLAGRAEFVEASAEALPFEDGSFDHLTFTYLLRYVDDPGATLTELARVVRPGGTIAMLEFAVPGGVWRPLWNAYCAVGLPTAGRFVSTAWRDVGAFLGPSIREFHARYPQAALDDLWRAAGVTDVRSSRRSLGGAVVMWGRRGS